MTKPSPAVTSSSTVVKQLTKLLGDTYALAVKSHGAHWNVRGPGFFRLHAAFEQQYRDLLEAADVLAERIRALGENAPTSMPQLSSLSNLSDSTTVEGDGLVRTLREDHRTLSGRCREAISVAQNAKDDATLDLLIKRAQEHDKTAWMLSATLGE
jgi:starvation-inducible DNA-binding protein